MNRTKNKWRVFVASTDFDLKGVRLLTKNLLYKLNFEPVMFENESFIIDSDIHSHETCMLSVKTADILILILDKRIGGPYLGKNENPSITQMEYYNAKENNIPTIVFMNKKLEEERFQKVKEIRNLYPNIKEQELLKLLENVKTDYANSGKLLSFIELIRKSDTANFISFYEKEIELEELIAKRLKALTPTILRRLSNLQKNAIGDRGTALGKDFDINTLLNSNYLVETQILKKGNILIHEREISFDENSKSAFILGKPGAGKTIFMSKKFIEANKKYSIDKSITFFFYFDLRMLKSIKNFSTQGILKESFKLFMNKDIYPLLDYSIINLQFVLDGLDEISNNLIQKNFFNKKIDKLIFSKCLISSRNSFYEIYVRGKTFEDEICDIYQIQDWTFSQSIEFVKKWLLNNDLSLSFVSQLEEFIISNKIGEIISSPILASMYAYTVKQLKIIPESISDKTSLYKHFISVLANREKERNPLLINKDKAEFQIEYCWNELSWIIFKYKLELKPLYTKKLFGLLVEKGYEVDIVNQAISGLVIVNPITNEIKSLLHETLFEFLLASYGVEEMKIGNLSLNEFLSSNLSSNVTLFVKELWKREDDKNLLNIINVLCNFIKQNIKKNNRICSNSIYYLSRIPLPELVIVQMKELLNNKLPIFLKNGILYALTKLQDVRSEELLSNVLINNPIANNLNRGLHLEYFGDIGLLSNSNIYPYDPGNTNVDKSIDNLFEHLKRSKIRDVYTSRIDSITIISLCVTREILTPKILDKLKEYLTILHIKYSGLTDIPLKALDLLNITEIMCWKAFKKNVSNKC